MIKYKVYITAGYTEKSRQKKLEKAKIAWEKASWKTIDVVDNGLTKASWIIVEGDDKAVPLKRYVKEIIAELSEDEVLRKLKLDKILLQIKSLGQIDTFGIKKEINSLADVLGDNEDLLGLAAGIMDGSTWLVACTPSRVILLDKGMIFGVKQKDFLLENINSIDFELKMMFGEINIVVSSDKMKIEKVEKNSVKKFVDTVKLAQSNLKNNNNANRNIDDDLISKLKELSELKIAGILNEEEFQKAKNKLLG